MIAEMALALVLLIGAGLMIRSFAALQQVRPGFDPSGVLTFRIALPPAKYPRSDARLALLRQMDEQPARGSRRDRRRPDLAAAAHRQRLALAVCLQRGDRAQLGERNVGWPCRLAGVLPRHGHAPARRALLRRPRRRHAERSSSTRRWRRARGPARTPSDKRLQVQPNGSNNRFATVVGVVEHIRAHDLSRAVRPQLYRPMGAAGRVAVVVRTRRVRARAGGGRHARDEVDRSRSAARSRDADAGARGGRAGAAAADAARDVALRRRGAAAVGGRHLRRLLVRGQPAHARDRHPHGARPGSREHPQPGARARARG